MAASVKPASTSADTRDRSMGSIPCSTGHPRGDPRQRPRVTGRPLSRLDAAAGDAVRDDPQEQFPLPGGPRLDAGLLGPRARLLGFDVMGGALDQYAPALAARHVDLVDLERHLVVAA